MCECTRASVAPMIRHDLELLKERGSPGCGTLADACQCQAGARLREKKVRMERATPLTRPAAESATAGRRMSAPLYSRGACSWSSKTAGQWQALHRAGRILLLNTTCQTGHRQRCSTRRQGLGRPPQHSFHLILRTSSATRPLALRFVPPHCVPSPNMPASVRHHDALRQHSQIPDAAYPFLDGTARSAATDIPLLLETGRTWDDRSQNDVSPSCRGHWETAVFEHFRWMRMRTAPQSKPPRPVSSSRCSHVWPPNQSGRVSRALARSPPAVP
ncbi:hypothetical protein B0T16DRAFT_151784 [Cercophora newfieldiana]|uniref:Uncharacterized protein n=1 Tax=Cercophora newfieldiana TaxID=92897 RepID=A0AA39Y5D1_9PEZI|nr:hypothetical protein B0T16DRAFT_151784 [Cercophora newfieldiana]